MTIRANTLVASLLLTATAAAQADTLTLESWRVDDSDLWEDVLIPVFQTHYPDIDIRFSPTSPTEYDSTVNARLQGGTAGDLITCRPFDVSLNLYEHGHLTDLSDMPEMANFDEVARSAWTTDEGDATFCMPMASVIHGFLYNTEIFDELGLEVPETEAEFFQVLDTIKNGSSYTPLALGTNDQWESNQIVFTNIGPTYWNGEEGRQALLSGEAAFTDPEFVAAFEQMARWGDYMGRGYQSQTYGDSQNLFALGRAAIYPTGSWDISYFNEQALFEFGAFPPVKSGPDGQCVISDHTDIGIGINANAENPEAARAFLEWLASDGFARLYTNEVTGFFSLSNHEVEVQDPVAAEMISWRQDCDSTIRLNAQIMNRGTPNMEQALWVAGSGVLNGTLEPEAAAERIQAGFEEWYVPQQ